MKSLACLGWAVVLLVPTACSYDLAERPTGGPVDAAVDKTAPTAAPLRDIRWELSELSGKPAPFSEQTPFLVLHDGRARAEGRANCNKFSGPYTAPAQGQLRLGPLVTTRSACPDLTAEASFFQALNKARHYRIRGNTLSLYTADTLGVPLAQFQAAPRKK
ncbi:META domain-containing protein [Hymenobacter sp. BT770]|nr:META domain-containing protein [Hymenobacter sp. BT770]